MTSKRPFGVRLAADADGPRIAELLAASGFTIDGLDWSEVNPYWLVAEEAGRVVGCIQLIVGKPMGWLEVLSLDPALGRKRRGRAVKALANGGAAMLKGAGCQVVMGVVPDELASYFTVLRRRGMVEVGHGFVMAKRL